MGNHRDVDSAVCHDGLAIQMHHARFLPDDGNLFSFKGANLAVPVYLLRKQLNSQRSNIKRAEGSQNRNVHLAILNVRVRSDESIVPILGSIAARNQKRLFLYRLFVYQQLIGFRLITQIRSYLRVFSNR